MKTHKTMQQREDEAVQRMLEMTGPFTKADVIIAGETFVVNRVLRRLVDRGDLRMLKSKWPEVYEWVNE